MHLVAVGEALGHPLHRSAPRARRGDSGGRKARAGDRECDACAAPVHLFCVDRGELTLRVTAHRHHEVKRADPLLRSCLHHVPRHGLVLVVLTSDRANVLDGKLVNAFLERLLLRRVTEFHFLLLLRKLGEDDAAGVSWVRRRTARNCIREMTPACLFSPGCDPVKPASAPPRARVSCPLHVPLPPPDRRALTVAPLAAGRARPFRLQARRPGTAADEPRQQHERRRLLARNRLAGADDHATRSASPARTRPQTPRAPRSRSTRRAARSPDRPLSSVVGENDWRAAIAMSVLSAPPLSAPMLLSDAEDLPDVTKSAMAALNPAGVVIPGQTLRPKAFVAGNARAARAHPARQPRQHNLREPLARGRSPLDAPDRRQAVRRGDRHDRRSRTSSASRCRPGRWPPTPAARSSSSTRTRCRWRRCARSRTTRSLRSTSSARRCDQRPSARRAAQVRHRPTHRRPEPHAERR